MYHSHEIAKAIVDIGQAKKTDSCFSSPINHRRRAPPSGRKGSLPSRGEINIFNNYGSMVNAAALYTVLNSEARLKN